MAIKKIGKKGKEWIKAKPKLIKKYQEEGITRCENCGSRYLMAFHHRPKRSTQEAVHDFDHTRLLCQKCHTFFEQNDSFDIKLFVKPRGYFPSLKIDIMARKSKSKKPDWQRLHKCFRCGYQCSSLICSNCGKVSVKNLIKE